MRKKRKSVDIHEKLPKPDNLNFNLAQKQQKKQGRAGTTNGMRQNRLRMQYIQSEAGFDTDCQHP